MTRPQEHTEPGSEYGRSGGSVDLTRYGGSISPSWWGAFNPAAWYTMWPQTFGGGGGYYGGTSGDNFGGQRGGSGNPEGGPGSKFDPDSGSGDPPPGAPGPGGGPIFLGGTANAPEPYPFPNGNMPPGGGYGGVPFNPLFMAWDPYYGYGGQSMPQYPGFSIGGGYNDPYNTYLSTVPVMQEQMKDNIEGAMAHAGLTGNRYSSSAQNEAGRIGAETGLQQNAMLNQLLYGQSNQDLNRALQASGMGTSLGLGLEQVGRGRLEDLFRIGGFEQGRQDRFGGRYLDDFNQSRLGYLPLLLNAAAGQGTPYQPGAVSTSTPGSPGLLDYFMAVAPYLFL